MSKEIHTYGFSKDQKWPGGVWPVPLDAEARIKEWPDGDIIVHLDSSRAFVQKVLSDKPDGLIKVALFIPEGRWAPPERYLAYFNRRVHEGNQKTLTDFLENP